MCVASCLRGTAAINTRIYVSSFKTQNASETNFNLFSAMPDPIRMFYCLFLCLFCMSEDVIRDDNETLYCNIGTIIHEFDQNERPILRSFENLIKKQTNARYAVIFNDTCIYIYI